MTDAQSRILHAVVGHKLPTYFLNTITSVLEMAPADDLLIVDNASYDAGLTLRLEEIAHANEHVRLQTRTVNDRSRNPKVGGLYAAYRDIVALALAENYDYLHLIQGDMQMVSWDDMTLEEAVKIYALTPECVNIHTTAVPRDRQGELGVLAHGIRHLRRYGLTDTGLYDLRRWAARGMSFAASETEHSRRYQAEGHVVPCHPHPPVAQIPWPAVVRGPRVIGREVQPVKPFLLRPLKAAERRTLRERDGEVWLEDVCVPWGWTCLSPMNPTAPESFDYWVFRYRALRRDGVVTAMPHWDRRGLEVGIPIRSVQRRPELWRLIVDPLRAMWRRRRAQNPQVPN